MTDARLGYRLGAWSMQAVMRNVLDRRYATFGTFDVDRGGAGVLERFLTPSQPPAVELLVRRDFAGER